jgi:protein SCO1/2
MSLRATALCLVAALGAAHAQPAPRAIAASGLDERIGAQVPLDVPFTAAGIGTITLRRLLDGKRPVLLVIAYARCTMLCSLVLRGVTEVARALPRTPGVDYELVLIGLDARETIDEARRKQASLLAGLGRGTTPDRWPYLVGDRASIDAVANAVGFRYAWDPRTEQYAHPAVIFALTPEGRVSRYLHGVQFAPDEVAAALDDAAAGRLITSAAEAVLRCFRFDPASRRAGARAQLFLQVGAAFMFLVLFCAIALLLRWERRRDAASRQQESTHE